MNNLPVRKMILFCLEFSLILFLTTTLPMAFAQARGNRPAYVPGELIVKYKPSSQVSAQAFYRTNFNISTLRTFKSIQAKHVKLPEGMSVSQALNLYGSDPDVEYVEPNYYLYASYTPDDTFYDRLWALNNTGQTVNGTSGSDDADMDVAEAWDTTTGSSGVIVAVIDSGVDYNHPDLKDNIWTNPAETAGNSIDDDGNGKIDDVYGWDFLDNDNDPIDPRGHGTHVAGTIAAVGDNEYGISGVSWAAKIMVLRFLNAYGVGTTANAISAIEYANDKGADIINCSWGGYAEIGLKNAIEASTALVVCAAGNHSPTGNDIEKTKEYPASYDSANIISVAATDQDDALYDFSNYGATSVDVGAPGVNIYSTLPGRVEILSEGFEDSIPAGWVTGGTNNTWDVTTAQANSGSYSLTDSPAGGNYADDTDSWVRLPAFDLSAYKGVKLQFQIKVTTEEDVDFLYVETTSDLGSEWNRQTIGISGVSVDGLSGSQESFIQATVDLGAFDGQNPVYFRFRFVSNSSVSADGVYIDDVVVSAADATYTEAEYGFKDGTSMAAPHVAGVAALVKTRNPSATSIQIKAAIENSVDSLSALSGRCTTGGRVNARAALGVPAPPSGLSATTVSDVKIDLGWTDNSDNETGFKIERSTDGVNFTQIDTVGTNVTTYSDTGLSASTQYTYRVKAYNNNGDSGYSATASTRTAGTLPGGPGGCFIATAAYGSADAVHVKTLRAFRDRFLLPRAAGRAFVRFYYRHSPPIADVIARHPLLRGLVRFLLLPIALICGTMLNNGPASVLFVIALVLMGGLTVLAVMKKYRLWPFRYWLQSR